MKKISLYIAALASLMVVTSCTEDYNADVAAPQAWDQEEISTIPAMTLTAGSGINLETTTSESVQFVSYSFGEIPTGGEISSVVVEVAQTAGDAKTTITHTDGAMSVEELQSLIESYFGKAAELRTLSVSAYATLDLEGQASRLTSNSVSVEVMPKTPIVVPEFYLVGDANSWDVTSKALGFYPVDAEAATLSLTTNLNGYFKIFSGESIGDWANPCYGTAVDGDSSLTGTLVVDNCGAIQSPTSDIYTLNIDMINLTYEMVLEANQSPTTYTAIGLIGAFNGWDGDAALTEVAPHCWYLEGFVQSSEGELKFRANNDWAVSWGNGANIGDVNYGVLEENGSNMTLPVGTYNIYFNDITYQTYFITQE